MRDYFALDVVCIQHTTKLQTSFVASMPSTHSIFERKRARSTMAKKRWGDIASQRVSAKNQQTRRNGTTLYRSANLKYRKNTGRRISSALTAAKSQESIFLSRIGTAISPTPSAGPHPTHPPHPEGPTKYCSHGCCHPNECKLPAEHMWATWQNETNPEMLKPCGWVST